MLGELIKEFWNQSEFGIIICWIILLLIPSYVLISIGVSLYYKKKSIQLEKVSEEGEFLGEDIIINGCIEEFKKSVNNGTENVNTQVIIDKNMSKSVVVLEAIMKYMKNVAIVIGLLGTFIGLVMAITDISAVFGKITEDSMSMNDSLLAGMKEPLLGMSTAFYTSIMGILASIILNVWTLLPKVSYVYEKESFYDELENLLDNVIFSANGISEKLILSNFTGKVEDGIKYMADNLAKSFEDGIEKLTNKINYVGIDLKESSNTLFSVINRLEDILNVFSEPIETFKESVDKFGIYNEEFDNKINKINKSIANLGVVFERTTDTFENSGEKLKGTMDTLIQSYDDVKNLIEEVKSASMNNQNITKEMIEKEKIMFEQIEDILKSFNKNVMELSVSLSNTVKEEFKGELRKITIEISKNLKDSLSNMENLVSKYEDVNDVYKERLSTLQNLMEEISS